MLECDVGQPDGFGYGLRHADFFAYTVNEVKLHVGPQDGQRYARKPSPGAEVENGRACARGHEFAYRQRVEDVAGIDVVDVLARNDVDAGVPLRVERPEGGKLLAL